MREKYRKSIASLNKFPQFTTMNVIDGQAGLIIYTSLIFYSLTIDNILNIIVLLILAGVTIATLTGENGILGQANKAKVKTTEAEAIERVQFEVAGSYGTNGEIDLEQLKKKLANITGLTYDSENFSLPSTVNLNGYDIIIDTNGNVTKKITVANAKTNGTVFKDNTTIYDTYYNHIKVPAGFKIADDSATDVTGGIVIEDANYPNTMGSQFVWIPIGKVNNAQQTETITLARYTFANDGTPSVYSGSYTEDTTTNHDSSYGNKIAKDIEDFKTKAIKNHGFWFGRYEARKENNNLVCKYDKSVYSRVIQSQASSLSKDMYKEKTFTSDLVNSYAWDTAILFIQTFSGDTDYSIYNKNSEKSTDEINYDVRCNIYDMAGNYLEWSTETSGNVEYPCTRRGGSYNNGNASLRGYDKTSSTNVDYSFRIILYL